MARLQRFIVVHRAELNYVKSLGACSAKEPVEGLDGLARHERLCDVSSELYS